MQLLCQGMSKSDETVLTSSLAAFLHAVLINVQREQHVGVPSHFLVCVRRAGAARSNGCVQEESGFLSRRGAQLTLVLELPGRGGIRGREGKVRLGKVDHIGLEKKKDRCEKDTGKRG